MRVKNLDKPTDHKHFPEATGSDDGQPAACLRPSHMRHISILSTGCGLCNGKTEVLCEKNNKDEKSKLSVPEWSLALTIHGNGIFLMSNTLPHSPGKPIHSLKMP